MTNYIIISRTFSEVTPESAEHGDFSDKGFISEYEKVSFSELVDLMRNHTYTSQSPVKKLNTDTWLSCYPYTPDYKTGTERTESIHFHRDNTSNAAKYWNWAYQIAKVKS